VNITFDWADFSAPLDPAVLVAAILLGCMLGAVVAFSDGSRRRRLSTNHFIWMTGAGVVFYIPLSIIRAFEGSPVWERFLATLPLWMLFELGMMLGNRYMTRGDRTASAAERKQWDDEGKNGS
jgi:hypothetical protein